MFVSFRIRGRCFWDGAGGEESSRQRISYSAISVCFWFHNVILGSCDHRMSTRRRGLHGSSNRRRLRGEIEGDVGRELDADCCIGVSVRSGSGEEVDEEERGATSFQLRTCPSYG